jgi:hypothetical protein
MSTDEWDRSDAPPAVSAAYHAVRAVLSDDHNYERGVEEARRVAEAVLADEGSAGLVETAVELALKLGEALERIAVEQRLAAVELVEVWWADGVTHYRRPYRREA